MGAKREAAVWTWTVDDQIEIPERRKGVLEVQTEPVRPILNAPDEKGSTTLRTRRRPEDQKPSEEDHCDTDPLQQFLQFQGRK